MSAVEYANAGLTRAEVDAMPGDVVLEFGATWCPICQGAQDVISSALAPRGLQPVHVEDGPGRPLGRSFKVKLWPTLIFLRDGREMSRVVRPKQPDDLAAATAALDAAN